MHLIMDGHSKRIDLMTNQELLRDFIINTITAAGMTPYGEPDIKGYPWVGSDDWSALSGYCHLKESGMMVHCYPEKEYVFIDLFSCKDFDEDRVIGHIARAFQIERCKILLLERGIDMNTGEAIPARLRRNYDGEYPSDSR